MDARNPKITIITATYYRPDLLARAIKSVQQSTFTDYEHIIVSDHCPKAQQVYELFSDDKRIRFFEQDPPHIPNHGSRAHNLAIREAKTDLFCYLGDDNIVLPNHIGLMYEGLVSNFVVETKTHHIDIGSGDHMVKKILERDFRHDLEPETYLKQDLKFVDYRDVSSLGHTRRVYDIVGPWRLTHECASGVEDNEFMNRLDQQVTPFKIDTWTCVYYARGSCFIRDDFYHEQVCSLGKNEVFVFPELLKQTGVLTS